MNDLDPYSPSQTVKLPSQGIRTTISLLLFLHLAALALAVTSNALPASPLRRQLGNIPLLGNYMQILDMDSGYTFHLTDDAPLDADHFVELQLNSNTESTPEQVLRLPEAGLRIGPRAERYRNLTVNVARRLSDELGSSESENLLPRAISQKLLDENGISQGRHRFRLRRLLPLSMEQASSMAPADRDPHNPQLYQTAYEADVTFYKGEVQLTRSASALEVSPVRRER